MKRKYKAAALLMIIHGGIMELAGLFLILYRSLSPGSPFEAQKYFSFKLPYFQENLDMMILMGVIYGLLRVIGAMGLLKNRMWGLALSVINCVTTMVLMMFLLPAGIADGLLAGSALVLILMGYFGDRKIQQEIL